jgi:choline dehydrogenase-like flavoprotein
MASERYDVIIIGTGAGGGTLAYRLAPTGKRILLLERGDFLPRERDNWDPTAVFVQSKYKAQETWYGKDGRAFHPGIHYYVGGNTKFYGAALFRLRKEDFGEIRHHGGISPAWPIGYADFEPYYSEAEQLYHVHGEHGADPTEPPASRPYPHPPVSHELRIQEFHDGLRARGYHPFPLPLGILLDEAEGKPKRHSACIRCDAFDGYPCLVNGKADAQVICVDPALDHPNVTLLTNAYVRRLDADGSGRTVTKVLVERGGALEEYAADIVVVSCGAINSALLLLRSANDRHPHGLANSSGSSGVIICATTTRPSWPYPANQTRLFFRRRWRSTISISVQRIGITPSGTSRCSASRTARRSRARHRIGCSGNRRCPSTRWHGTLSISG